MQHPKKFTDYSTWTPIKYKQNLILSLLWRAKTICSTDNLYKSEKSRILEFLLNSGYKMRTANRFLEKAELKISKPKYFGPLEKTIYYGMHYYGFDTLNYQKDVSKSFTHLKPPGSRLIFYYKKEQTLQSIFARNYKDFGNDPGKSGVYCINCQNCDRCYIGQTGRPFQIRLNEHRNYKGDQGKYATYDHHIKTGHQMNFSNARLLWTEYRNDNRLFLESLFMKDHNLLDNNTCSKTLNIF